MPRVTVTNNEPSTKNNELYPPILLPSTTPSYLTKQQTPSLTLSGSLTRAPSTKSPACLVLSIIIGYILVPVAWSVRSTDMSPFFGGVGKEREGSDCFGICVGFCLDLGWLGGGKTKP